MSNSQSSFQLSDHIDQDKIFLVNLSEIESRIDPIQFNPNRVAAIERLSSNRALTKLSKVTTSQKNIVGESNLPYVGLENIKSHTGEYVFTQDKNGFGSANTFSKGSILFPKLRPYLNKVHLAEFEGVCSTEFHVLTSKDEFSNEFLAIYLRTDLILNQTKHLMTGNTLPRLQTKDVSDLPVPLLDISLQKNIVDTYNGLMTQRTIKIKEAQNLLDSIDNYLLAELDIKVPYVDNSLPNRIFTVQASELSEPRLDPEYLAKKYRKMEDAVKNSLFNIQKLSDVTYLISSGKTPSKIDYVNDVSKHDKVYDIIKVGSYSQDLINSKKLDQTIIAPKFEVKKGDIFILSAAHQSEYVGKHIKFLNVNLDNVGCVGELICVRANNNIILNSYLFSILKTDIFKTLINRRKTGQTSHVYPRDIRKIEVPVPNMTKQQEIVEHIDHIRATAASLQKEANDILVSAKQQIENMILGEKV